MKCTKCNLYKTSKSGKYTCVKLDGSGNILSDIMLVGEAPGANEIIERKVFVGQAGQLLRKYLKTIGINPEDIFITNVVKCRPPMNRTPTDIEVKACSEYLEEEIGKVKPKVIGLLGNTATKYFLGKSKITQLHGKEVWDEKHNCWLIPLYHPSYVMRFNKNSSIHLEFKSDLQKLFKLTKEDKKEAKKTTIKIADTIEKVRKATKYLLQKEEWSFDIETTGLSFLTDKILCLQFSPKETTAIVIPFQDERIFNIEEQEEVKKELKKLFKSDIKKIAQNGKFDIKFLIYNGIEVNNFYFDTLLASYLLNEEGKFGLSDLAFIYTDMGKYKDELREYITGAKRIPYQTEVIKETKDNQLDFFKEAIQKRTVTKTKKATILDAPLELLYEYAGKDADATYRIYKILKELLKEGGLDKLFYKIVMPVNMVLARMELNGISLDKEYLINIVDKVKLKINKLEEGILNSKEIKGFLDEYKIKEFNINSPIQLRKLLFDFLNLPSTKTTKKGSISTDKEALEELNKVTKSKLLNDILVYRKAEKFYATYIKPYYELSTNSIDNKIHTIYKLHGTVTGRLSSSKPNLQNIPKRDKAAILVRKALVVENKENVLIESDYKQLEFRIFAHFTNDQKLIEMAGKEDIHAEIASQIFNKPVEKISKNERSLAKTAVFGGIMYGGGAYIIVSKFGIEYTKAEKIITEFFNQFPTAYDYIEKEKRLARKRGYVINLFGRKRRLNDIYSRDQNKLNIAYRQAINARIQSTAADIVYLAMIKLDNILKNKNCKMLLNIHDAIIFEYLERDLKEGLEIIRNGMEKIIKLKVPLKVDIEVGKNLGELSKINNI